MKAASIEKNRPSGLPTTLGKLQILAQSITPANQRNSEKAWSAVLAAVKIILAFRTVRLQLQVCSAAVSRFAGGSRVSRCLGALEGGDLH